MCKVLPIIYLSGAGREFTLYMLLSFPMWPGQDFQIYIPQEGILEGMG